MSGETGTQADLSALADLPARDVEPARREAIRARCHARLRPGAPVRRAWEGRMLEPALASTVAVLYLLAVLDRAVVVLAR